MYHQNSNIEHVANAVITNCFIKLKHAVTGRILHSHYIKYETGSKCQEVSACGGNDQGGDAYDWWEMIKIGNIHLFKQELIESGLWVDDLENAFTQNEIELSKSAQRCVKNNNLL